MFFLSHCGTGSGTLLSRSSALAARVVFSSLTLLILLKFRQTPRETSLRVPVIRARATLFSALVALLLTTTNCLSVGIRVLLSTRSKPNSTLCSLRLIFAPCVKRRSRKAQAKKDRGAKGESIVLECEPYSQRKQGHLDGPDNYKQYNYFPTKTAGGVLILRRRL